ncbi:multicilin [Columba livia]|uniref:multicilin n=1 Tax=Columba livia TaxID=8932 RepID=UPI0031BB0B7E
MAPAPRALACTPARGAAPSGTDGARRVWGRGRCWCRYRGGSMEQGGRRRAFGSICPNRVQGPPVRLAKKPARPDGGAAGTPRAALSPRAPPPRPRRSGAAPAPAAPALAVTTIDWQDLAACAPTLSTAPASPVIEQQDPCFQDGPEFLQFRDAVDDFISEASTLMPPPLDYTDFDFSLGEEVAFAPCTAQLESSTLVQMPPQRLPSPEQCWRDLMDQHQKALGDALEADSQLQETLTQKQEELVTLQESNVQLKELAIQARQLAAILDTLTLPQCNDEAALPPPLHPPPTPPATAPAPAGVRRGRGRPEPWKEAAGVDAMLREVSEKCRAALRLLRGSPGSSPGGSPTAKRPRPAPRLHGAFRGLRTGRTAPRPDGVGVEWDGSMRAALGEAGSIRTLAFPQGNAFTLRTAAGGYRFRWVPR